MIPSITIDRDEVKLTAAKLGSLKAAALAHGLNLSTVRSWAKRGNWPTDHRLRKNIQSAKKELILAKNRQNTPPATLATQSSDVALQDVITDCKQSFHRSMSKALKKGAAYVEGLDGSGVVSQSRKLKDLSDTGKTILGIGADTSNQPTVNIGILGLSLNFRQPDASDDAPTHIDI